MKHFACLAALLLTVGLCAAADAAFPEFDFRPGFDAKRLYRPGDVRYTFADGVCRAENTKPSRFAGVHMKLGIPCRFDLQIAFDYRCVAPADAKLAYVGTNFTIAKKTWFTKLDVSKTWQSAVVKLAPFEKRLPPDCGPVTVFSIYSRISDKDPAAACAIEVRNIRISLDPGYVPPKPEPDRKLLSGLEKNYLPDALGELAVRDGALECRADKSSPRKIRINIRLDEVCKPGMKLVFEYKNFAPHPIVFSPSSVGVQIAGRPSVDRWITRTFDWRRVELPLGTPENVGAKVLSVSLVSPLSRRQVTVPNIGTAIRNVHFEIDPNFDAASLIPVSMSAIPHIDWREGKLGTRYELTLSGNGTTRKFELARNWFFPPEPLAPGVWSWRVTADGKTCGQGQFRVTESSHRWTAPAVDEAKLAALPRPKLRKLAEYWQPNDLALKYEIAQALRYKTPDNPLPYQAGDPRYPSWADWHRIVNSKVADAGRRLQALAAAYSYDPQAKYADKAKEIILKVAREWDPEGGSHISGGDLRASTLLLGMCFVYDIMYDRFTPEERADVAKNIRVRAEQFWRGINPIRGRDGNHCWYCVCAASFAAVTLGENLDRFAFAVSLFAYRFLPGRGFDGESEEGINYWSYGFGLAMKFLDLANIVCGVNLYDQPWVRRTARFPLYCQPLAGYSLPFGDMGSPNHTPVRFSRTMLGALARHTHDAEARWFAGLPAEGPVKIPADIPQSMLFRHVGQAVFHTFLPDARENVQLGFHSGKYFGNHQHADQNSFIINAYGDKLAVDGGYYDSTDTPHFAFYSTATVAHNTILVNGQGQAIHSRAADGKITGFLDTPDFGYVAGDASAQPVYGSLLSKFDRRIVFVKPDYVVVYDSLAAPRPATFQFLLHAQQEKGRISVDGAKFGITRPRAELYGKFLLPEKVKITSAQADYVSPPRQWDSFELNPSVKPEQLLTAANPAPETKLEFLVPMKITRSGGKPAVWRKIETADVVAAVSDDVVVAFSRKPGTLVKIGHLEFDGPAAAVRFAKGKPVSGMRTGKILRRQGADVPIRTKQPVAWEKVAVTFDGKPLSADKAVRELADGTRIECVSCVLPKTKAAGLLRVRTAGTQGTRYLFLSSVLRQSADEIGSGVSERLIPLDAEPTIFTVTSTAPIGAIDLATRPIEAEDAVAEAPDFRPPAGAIVIEAESMDADLLSRLRAVSRKSASGGLLLQGWRPGTAGEMDISVPADGDYILRFRMANSSVTNARQLVLDERIQRIFRAGPTSGFGYAPGEWKWFTLKTPIRLTAGKHRLKLVSLIGDGNLDCFSIEKQ